MAEELVFLAVRSPENDRKMQFSGDSMDDNALGSRYR